MPKEVQVESSFIPEKVAGDIEARAIMEHAMASAAGLRLEHGHNSHFTHKGNGGSTLDREKVMTPSD